MRIVRAWTGDARCRFTTSSAGSQPVSAGSRLIVADGARSLAGLD
jgi:hypothetical protein